VEINFKTGDHIDPELFEDFMDQQFSRAASSTVSGAPATNGQPSEVVRSSWYARDLTPVLDGTWEAPQPTVGARTDGKGLFYPGKTHTVVGETEAAKTWLALSTSLDEMGAGHHVLYLDFEDDEGTVGHRLLITSGQSANMIRQQLHYVRPEGPLGDPETWRDLLEMLAAWRPTLVILDGITEAMGMHGWDPLSNADIAKWNNMLAKLLARRGSAVVSLDHVVKNSENRGRYALGGVHKLNAVSGAGYILENRSSFGIGMTGKSGIFIAKDRPGQLRHCALPSGNSMHWYGDLVLESHGEDFAELSIQPPHEADENFRPTHLMQQIADLLAAKGPLSENIIETSVRGKNDRKRQAINYLILDGYVSEKTPHALLKPYGGGQK
jgi:hypothetical protein